MTTSTAPQPDYGFDGPRGLVLLLLVSVGCLGVAIGLGGIQSLPPWGILLAQAALLIVAADCLLLMGSLLWYSKIEKPRAREQLLNLIPWHGEEVVLDVGCGRGLLLVGAARRLTTGRAVGVDVWHGLQLSGNHPQAAKDNARRAAVAERVEVRDGDARSLPFGDASFDVVLSSLVLHNIPSRAGRHQAVRELARVLKPGGHVAVLDVRYTGDYVNVLRDCGLIESRRERAGWLLSGLFPLLSCGLMQFYRVTARKPLVNENNKVRC
jgi:ubiquinone/menaquinone biosynthesis C-methylase UbiE